jgi:RimJ/RimL family protein N-acetyltransferase
MCETKYLFSYVLGKRDKANKKAIQGSAMHHVLELLAMKKLAINNGEETVTSEIGTFTLDELDDIDRIAELSYYYYKNHEGKGLKWEDIDRKNVIKWCHTALAYNGGEMDPRNQNVWACEEFFDFEVKKDWAKYSYTVGDEIVDGYLRLRGTVDLITIEDEERKLLHIQDYKSGRRWDWANDKIKEHEDFYKDPQLLFYYYALRNKYPDYEFLVSIYYVNDHKIDGELVKGGLFTVVFDDRDYERAEDMIRQKFEYIRSVEIPSRIDPSNSHWKCRYLCKFSEIDPETGESACEKIHRELKYFGLDAVTAQHADLSKQNVYEGGGKYNVAIDKDT